MLRVIGVGDNFVDRYWDEGIMYPGGNSVNFAVYASQMGVSGTYCGVFADDTEAELIRDALERQGVDYSHSTFLHAGETGKGSIRLIEGDRVISDDNEGGSVRTETLIITDELLKYLKEFDVIHTCCYGYLTKQLPKLSSCGVPVIYDFSDQWNEELFQELCPHIKIAFFSGRGWKEEKLKDALQKACACGAEIAITTRGENGAMAYGRGQFFKKAPYRIEGNILDTMGAGDAFLTGFTVAYYSGKKLYREMTGDAAIELASEDSGDFFKQLVEYAMHVGNLRAWKSCGTKGAFGMGVPINKK